MDGHRRSRGTLAALALLTAVVIAGPAGGAHAATASTRAMPRFVVADGDRIVVIDSTGRTTAYTSDGEQVWSPETSTQHMDWPARGRVTSEFGWRGGRMHNGIDIGTPMGTPITAAAGGRVSFAGWKGGYGKTVEIDHGDGTMTRYAHQSAMNVSEDDRVRRGAKIGEVGMTGSSTGPHLHFEIHADGDERNPRNRLMERA